MPNYLINIKDSAVTSELKDRAPTVKILLRAVASSVQPKGSAQRKTTKKDNKIARAISMTTSVLLQCKNPSKSAMSYHVS